MDVTKLRPPRAMALTTERLAKLHIPCSTFPGLRFEGVGIVLGAFLMVAAVSALIEVARLLC